MILGSHMLTLQNIIAPEAEICTESRLYFRKTGPVDLSPEQAEFRVPAGQRLSFDTYFNLFSLDSWSRCCNLDGLFLEILGRGRAEIQILGVKPGQADPQTLFSRAADLDPDRPLLIDLTELMRAASRGALYLELTALEGALTFSAARFLTNSLPVQWPKLALSITTFRREAAVRRTVQRLRQFLRAYEHGENILVQVVDNGQSAEIPSDDQIVVHGNRNLGGAGGFARGLLEAQSCGATHCLFMDDDATFHMENVLRTYAFLALAQDPRTAVVGAMIASNKTWALWENGARFDGSCRPLHNGVDLRDPSKVFALQQDDSRAKPPNFYGGWWYFAFPLENLSHYPFPFFVRGDDVSFSIANDFDFHTLSGVVSFQDDFAEKESALTLYLDLRSHLVHLLVLDCLDRSALASAMVVVRFTMRSLLKMHYSSARAQLLAVKDVLAGPEFFEENIDMQARRAAIKQLSQDEEWRSDRPGNPVETPMRPRRFWRILSYCLGLIILNGHLIPFWSSLARKRHLDISQRDKFIHVVGACEVTFWTANRDRSYALRHSKRRFFAILWQMVAVLFVFCRHHKRLRTRWREGYERMTQKSFWAAQREARSGHLAEKNRTGGP